MRKCSRSRNNICFRWTRKSRSLETRPHMFRRVEYILSHWWTWLWVTCRFLIWKFAPVQNLTYSSSYKILFYEKIWIFWMKRVVVNIWWIYLDLNHKKNLSAWLSFEFIPNNRKHTPNIFLQIMWADFTYYAADNFHNFPFEILVIIICAKMLPNFLILVISFNECASSLLAITPDL